MSARHNVWVAQCLGGTMSVWHYVCVARCLVVKMYGFKIFGVKMSLCQKVKCANVGESCRLQVLQNTGGAGKSECR